MRSLVLLALVLVQVVSGLFNFTQPQAGTIWIETGTYTISWIVDQTQPSYVNIDLLRPNDPSGFHNLGQMRNNGSIQVTMAPHLFSTSQGVFNDWQIRLSNINNANDYSLSPNFTIIVPVLSNITLNPGNGNLWVTDSGGLAWTTNVVDYVPYVNINLANVNGSSRPMATNLNNTGTFMWPKITSDFVSNTTYYFQLCWSYHPTICWQTPTFNIAYPWVTAQVVGSVMTGGNLNVNWASSVGYSNITLVTSVTAVLLQNNTNITSMPLLCNTPSNYTITQCSFYPLPFWLPTGNYQVQLCWNTIQSVCSTTNNFFIDNPIRVGFDIGSTVIIGEPYTVSWGFADPFSASFVNVLLYKANTLQASPLNSSNFVATLYTSSGAANSSFVWNTGNTNASLSQLYVLQVVYPYSTQPYGISQPFRMIATTQVPAIQILSPSYQQNTTWQENDKMTIQWTGGASYLLLDISLTFENGEVIRQIATSVPSGNSSIMWHVPSGLQVVRSESCYIMMCYVSLQNATLNICTASDPFYFKYAGFITSIWKTHYLAVIIASSIVGTVLLVVIVIVALRRNRYSDYESINSSSRKRRRIAKGLLAFLALIVAFIVIIIVLLTMHKIKCMPSAMRFPYWQCPVDNLSVSADPIIAGQPAVFKVTYSPHVFGVKYNYRFSDGTSTEATSDEQISHTFPASHPMSDYTVTVTAYTHDYATTILYTAPIVYEYSPSTVFITADQIIGCSTNTVLMPTNTIKSLGIAAGNILVSGACSNIGGLMHSVNFITYYMNNTGGISITPTDITNVLQNTFWQEIPIDFNGNSSVAPQPLITQWIPSVPFKSSPSASVTVTVQPNITFSPNMNLSTTIVDSTLKSVSISFSGPLTIDLSTTVQITGVSVSYATVIPAVYTKAYNSFFTTVPGLQLPLFITPSFSVSVGVNVTVPSAMTLYSSMILQTEVTGSIEWSVINGFETTVTTDPFKLSYDDTPNFYSSCSNYSSDIYVIPSISLQVGRFVNFALAPSPHTYQDRIYPPPPVLHGAPVNCKCSYSSPKGFSAMSGGVAHSVGLTIDKSGAAATHSVQNSQIILENCWSSSCGSC